MHQFGQGQGGFPLSRGAAFHEEQAVLQMPVGVIPVVSHKSSIVFKSMSFSRRRSILAMRIFSLFLCSRLALGYVSPAITRVRSPSLVRIPVGVQLREPLQQRSSTSLQVWWFGGTEQNEVNSDDESCELVAVRIERTSANSRRIAGEITVPARLDEVWSILTDYDRLAIHVPNLMESRIAKRNSGGEPGDGQFRCRLFQKGAQKIIGFDFSASVTMDMTEKLLSNGGVLPEERAINFKCVDSQFFKEFDGSWKVKERMGPDGNPETVCSYTVDVRPKGPVPVAALEWRIREDVPTNLRAVKSATMRINAPNTIPLAATSSLASIPEIAANRARKIDRKQSRILPILSDWDRDETMARYL